MPAKIISNHFTNPKTKLDYSRSIFKYERTHTTNMLTGLIVPVGYIDCMPGDTVPNKFGFVLQSAPLLGPSVDNCYIDIISVWCPHRLVMANFNEWLGDNDTFAWTIPNNVKLPKITKINTAKTSGNIQMSRSYVAEHFLGNHYGFRLYNPGETGAGTDLTSYYPTASRMHDGINVIPFRQYMLIWNRLFRNENVQAPILFSKQTGVNLSLDTARFTNCGGYLQRANRLKNMFTTAHITPAIQSVDIGLGKDLPVGALVGATGSVANEGVNMSFANASGANGFAELGTYGTTSGAGGKVYADLSQLTVNSLYYAQMLQRYYYKASNGRRPVEFYKNQFGLSDSNATYDDPQLLSQKRYKINISRIVATSNSTDAQSNTQPLGTQGAFSITSVGGTLFPEFTATEYGMLHVFAVIRTQESFASGIDRYLSHGELLSTYLPVFDHIGEDSIEKSEFTDFSVNNSNYVFGYQRAWYDYRYQVNDVVGIAAPGQPLGYFTFAREFVWSGIGSTLNDDFISQSPFEVDRMLQFPVCYSSGAQADIDGEPYYSDRYQWLIQFALAGDFARTMSKDSEPLVYGRL